MQYNRLGNTGLIISRLAFGAMTFGSAPDSPMAHVFAARGQSGSHRCGANSGRSRGTRQTHRARAPLSELVPHADGGSGVGAGASAGEKEAGGGLKTRIPRDVLPSQARVAAFSE